MDMLYEIHRSTTAISEKLFKVFAQFQAVSLVIALYLIPVDDFGNFTVGLKNHAAKCLSIFNQERNVVGPHLKYRPGSPLLTTPPNSTITEAGVVPPPPTPPNPVSHLFISHTTTN